MEKKNGFIALRFLGYSTNGATYEPVIRDENECLKFFDTMENALDEIIEHKIDDEEGYDYIISPAILTGEIIECTVNGDQFAMYRSDDDYIPADEFFEKLKPKTFLYVQVVTAIDEFDAKIKALRNQFDPSHPLHHKVIEFKNESEFKI